MQLRSLRGFVGLKFHVRRGRISSPGDSGLFLGDVERNSALYPRVICFPLVHPRLVYSDRCARTFLTGLPSVRNSRVDMTSSPDIVDLDAADEYRSTNQKTAHVAVQSSDLNARMHYNRQQSAPLSTASTPLVSTEPHPVVVRCNSSAARDVGSSAADCTSVDSEHTPRRRRTGATWQQELQQLSVDLQAICSGNGNSSSRPAAGVGHRSSVPWSLPSSPRRRNYSVSSIPGSGSAASTPTEDAASAITWYARGAGSGCNCTYYDEVRRVTMHNLLIYTYIIPCSREAIVN